MAIAIVGLDLAKHVFQVHAVDESGRAILRRQLRRASTTAGFEVKFVVSNGFSGLAAGADDASATMRMQPRDQAAGPKPDARAGVALPAR